jgi:hypothetical protein
MDWIMMYTDPACPKNSSKIIPDSHFTKKIQAISAIHMSISK